METRGFILAAAVIAMAFTISCREEKVVELESLQWRDDGYVVPETQKPYSGKYVTYVEYAEFDLVIRKFGILKISGSLKNGKRHGEITTYHEDGSIYDIKTFAEGVLNGKNESYHKNGKLMHVGHYKDGKRDGKWEGYYENEKLWYTVQYKDGKLDGKGKFYDENGKLITAQPSFFIDSRDGKKYKTVDIGEQTWMAENLNYDASGGKCYGEGGKVIMSFKDEKGKTLSNREVLDNCKKYGRLYDWATALKSCPSGWHLPSNNEWEKLENIADDYEVAKAVLKASVL